MGNQDQLEGKWDQATGKVKEEIGDATDNERMEREGQLDQAQGNIKEGIGDVREKVEDVADDIADRGDFNR
jgi:uncharacterized protein YjbJ (UPF0337 family)